MSQITMPREVHVTHGNMPASGLPEDNGTGTEDDRYGPWMLVARRKIGQRKTNNSVNLRGPTQVGLGPQPHERRLGQLGGPKEWVTNMRNTADVEALGKHMDNGPFDMGREDNVNKEGASARPPNRPSASVKSKKEIARTKATKWNVKEAVGSSGKISINNPLKWSKLNTIGDRKTLPDQNQFSTTGNTEVGKQSWRQAEDGGQREAGVANINEVSLGVESVQEPGGAVLGEKDTGRPLQHLDSSSTHTNSGSQRTSRVEGNEYGCFGTHADFVPRKGESKRDAGDDGMELEEGSEATTHC